MILQCTLNQMTQRWHRAPYIFCLVLFLVLAEVSTNNFAGPWLLFVLISASMSLLISQWLTAWANAFDPLDLSEPTLLGFFTEWFLTNLIALAFVAWLVLTPLRVISGHPGFKLDNWSIWIVVSILSTLSTVLNLLYLYIQGFLSAK